MLLTSACNSLFYYPDRLTYMTPDKRGFQYQEGKLKTPDGEVLKYWVIAAKHKKIGTILHFHGNAQNMSAHFLFVAWLSEFGYEVINFDYRGYGQSTGIPDRQGLVVDGQVMLDFLESQQIPYFVIGQSLGGAVAIPAIASLKPTRLRGVILDSTFASYRGIAQCKLAENPITWIFQWPLSFLVSDELSPIDSVYSLDFPILQFHSRSDLVVPFAQGKELFDGFNFRKRFIALKRSGHTKALVPPFSQHHLDLLLWLCSLNDDEEVCKQIVEKSEIRRNYQKDASLSSFFENLLIPPLEKGGFVKVGKLAKVKNVSTD